MLTLYPIKAFQDNYHWLLADSETCEAAVVDPGDAMPVLQFLEERQLKLTTILITHHHADHIGGVATLNEHLGPLVIHGPATPRIPQVNQAVREGDHLTVLGHRLRVLEVPGHTLEHIAYVSDGALTTAGPALFCGDTLFAAGCGRMFEGNPTMMQGSLQKLADLPTDTLVYCAHEYTLGNLRFAAAVMPDNTALQARQAEASALRERGEPTVPSRIATELATNPFLRCREPEVVRMAASVETLPATDPASVFGALRRWKDRF